MLRNGQGSAFFNVLDGLSSDLGFGNYTAGNRDMLDFFFVTFALMVGTAGLPHVIIRFFTVPKIRDAVRSGLDASVESALPTVRDEVAAGVRNGAETIVPRVREEVRLGVEEAIANAVTGGVVGKAGEELARKGSSVLNRLLKGLDDR